MRGLNQPAAAFAQLEDHFLGTSMWLVFWQMLMNLFVLWLPMQKRRRKRMRMRAEHL